MAVHPDVLLVCVAALAVGSFLGVVIDRLPAGRSLLRPRSACELCGHALALRDLVPLASWLATAGRCRHCGGRLGWFHPAIELAALAVALSVLVVMRDQPLALRLASMGLGWTLLVLAWIDARWLLLPDVLTLPLIVTGLGVAWWWDAPLADHVVGAVAGFAGLAAIAALYRRLRGRDGLGLGDAKLLAAAGAWLGWAALPSVLLIAALTGLALGVALALWRRAPVATLAVPFGPSLALAFWLVWLFGPLVLA